MISISLAARNAAGNAIVALLDAGTTNPNGFIEIRTGTKPATPETSAVGDLLATLNFSNPAFGPFANGLATANTISPDTDVDMNGIAGWFRAYDRNGNAVFDGSITIKGGGGDLEFDLIDFLKAGTVQITNLTSTMPVSA
jgi:hypothetical protein